MLHNLWTRGWAWLTCRDRGQRYEVQLIFDEEEASLGALGRNNYIFAYSNAENLEAVVARAQAVPNVLRVNVIDRKTVGLQMAMYIYTLQDSGPRIMKTDVLMATPETLLPVIARMLEEAPRKLMAAAKAHLPDSGPVMNLIDVETWAGPRGRDISIRVFRSVETERRRYMITRSNEVLCCDGEWRPFSPGTYRATQDMVDAGCMYSTLLEVCRVLLGEEFEQLERAAGLWTGSEIADTLLQDLQHELGSSSTPYPLSPTPTETSEPSEE